MSIRMRLLLSNVAMIVIPVVLFFVAAFLFMSLFFGDARGPWSANTKHNETDLAHQQFVELRKLASLSPERLEDPQYLNEISKQLSIIIRKANQITYVSPTLQMIEIQDLPVYGVQTAGWPYEWMNTQFYLQSYDFYFADGNEGTIFLASDAKGNVTYAKTFFPVAFGLLLLVLIGTNGLLTYFVSRSILTPVNELNKAALKISEGDLDFQLAKGNKKDELGKLTQTFDYMRQKLKDSIKLQLQYEENRKELVANISHDLKTPITSIKGYVEGIRDGVANTPEKMDRYLETIYTKSVEMDKLIDELALYSQLDMNRLSYNFVAVNGHSFFSEYVDDLKFEMDSRNAALLYHTEEDVKSCNVIVDKEKIKRVMNNIIINSLKYMDKEKKQIEFYIRVKRAHILIQIKDNGPGITPSELPFIFDRFYRADQSRSRKTGGSGLGLAIAKRIVEDHGGQIWAESKLGEGASVLFTLRKGESIEKDINC